MTPEFKAQWVAALRSGKYTQAKGCLRDTNGGMCCLGVAADLIDPSKWNAQPEQHDANEVTGEPELGFGWNGGKTEYTSEVYPAIDIPSEVATQLAQRNDGNSCFKPHSFAEIADYIEQNL